MKKLMLALAVISLTSSMHADETTTTQSRGSAAGYASRNATALSMMGWGVSLAVGIAALVCLIPNHAASGHN
jgi:hypothetical protein